MANPYHHAVSSARKWGGEPEDYQAIHDWFDQTKAHLPDFRHRALRHHSEGIFLCEQVFGKTITISTGKKIPTRWVGEQHVREDLGFIPTAADWLKEIKPAPWMAKSKKLSLELEAEEEEKAKAIDDKEAALYPDEEKTNQELLNSVGKDLPKEKRKTVVIEF